MQSILSVIAYHIKSRVVCQMNLYSWVPGLPEHLLLLHVMPNRNSVGENVKIAAKIYLKLGTIFPRIITLQDVFLKFTNDLAYLYISTANTRVQKVRQNKKFLGLLCLSITPSGLYVFSHLFRLR